MAKSSITVDTKSLDRLTLELKSIEKQVPGASAAALNRTLDFVATRIGRLIPQEYSIKTAEVKKSLTKKKASKKDLSAHIISRGHTLSIAHFPHNPKTPGGKRRSIKVKIKKADGYKKIMSDPKPFIASTGAKDSDKIQNNVFRRTTKKRFPIVALRTLSIPQMVGNERIEEQVQSAAVEKLSERIEHEINWRLSQAQKKISGG